MISKIIKIFILVVLFNFTLCHPAVAGDVSPEDYWGGDKSYQQVQDDILLEDSDPRIIASRVINITLGFLGIVFLILVLYAGFMWMMAAGNEDRVGKAKSVMIGAVIGLIIVLAAFGISRFVINALVGATS